LEELFASHPDTLEDADIDRMVIELRNQRQHFKVAKQTKAKNTGTIPMGTVDEIWEMLGGGKK
jgi:hypothetical protein